MLHVVFVFACILVVFFSPALFPLSLSTFDPIEKLAAIDVAILPPVLPVSFGLSEDILTDVLITYLKAITSFTMPEAILPFPFIEVAIFPGMFSEAIGLILDPLANILILPLPHAISTLESLKPLSLIVFSIGPFVYPLA